MYVRLIENIHSPSGGFEERGGGRPGRELSILFLTSPKKRRVNRKRKRDCLKVDFAEDMEG